MTLVVATPEGIWADRKITSPDGAAHAPMRKVASNGTLVAGFAGPAVDIRRACTHVVLGDCDVQELARAVRGELEGIAVRGGRIWYLSDGLAWPRGAQLYACGSGGAEARAWLAGRDEISDETVRLAHKYVAKARDDCGRGVVFVPTP